MKDPNYGIKLEQIARHLSKIRKVKVTAEDVQIELVNRKHKSVINMNRPAKDE